MLLKITWKEVTGTQEIKPKAVDAESSPHKVYLRRNIARITIEKDENKVKMWKYEEAELTHEEYREYETLVAELESPAITQLREENANLAAALADLYETQVAMQESIMLGMADIYELAATE